MVKQITFKLNDKWYELGQADAKNGVFDTFYLKGNTADSLLSYVAGWKSVETINNLCGQLIYTSEVKL